MALFGLIKKKSKTKSSFDQTQSVTNRILGQDVFESLFAGAGTAAAEIDTAPLSRAADALFASGGDIIGNLTDIAAGTDVSGQFQTGRITGEGSLLDENIAALQSDISKIFNETFLPGIASQAVGGGQLGGGRQGVAQGAAVDALSREFQRGALGLRTNELEARAGAARDLSASRLAGAAGGIAALPAQFGLAEAGTLAPLSPFAILSQILGDPQILSSLTRQFGKSVGKTSGTQIGAEFSLGS